MVSSWRRGVAVQVRRKRPLHSQVALRQRLSPMPIRWAGLMAACTAGSRRRQGRYRGHVWPPAPAYRPATARRARPGIVPACCRECAGRAVGSSGACRKKTVVIIPVIYGKSSFWVPPKMFNRVLITRAWAGRSFKWGTLKPFAALLSRSLTPIRLASRCLGLFRPVRRSVK